jgi:hypothetical protein
MNQELLDRLELIERMVLEGRRRTQYWGWTFVLWGTGQLIALAWQIYGGNPGLAWSVTMTVCGILTVIGSRRMHAGEQVETFISRSIGSIWWSCGIAITILAFIGNPTGVFTARSFYAALFALLGLANFGSGLMLRWKVQQGMGLLWWAAAIAAMLVPEKLTLWIFVAMDIIGEILFGLYLMAKERVDKSHARTA